MAVLDTYMPVDMLSGFDFSNLNLNTLTSASASDYTFEHSNGAFDWLHGYDLSIEVDNYGDMWVGGVVTGLVRRDLSLR